MLAEVVADGDLSEGWPESFEGSLEMEGWSVPLPAGCSADDIRTAVRLLHGQTVIRRRAEIERVRYWLLEVASQLEAAEAAG